MTGRRRLFSDVISLQFGHSVAAVDDIARVAIGLAVSFNSATASPPWMTGGAR